MDNKNLKELCKKLNKRKDKEYLNLSSEEKIVKKLESQKIGIFQENHNLKDKRIKIKSSKLIINLNHKYN